MTDLEIKIVKELSLQRGNQPCFQDRHATDSVIRKMKAVRYMLRWYTSGSDSKDMLDNARKAKVNISFLSLYKKIKLC